jgi:hypothetical protein
LDAHFELGRIVGLRGGELPEKQAVLEAEMQQWFINKYGDSPSISSIRRYVSKLYEEHGRPPK